MSALSHHVDSYIVPERAPRSPRHYDKYTYAARRKPENEADEIQPVSPRSQRQRRGELTEYETLVSGLAPLRPNEHGYCVAEDGAVSSRFVAPPRFSGPAIAMVGVPVTVVPSVRTGDRQQARSGVAYVHASGTGPIVARPTGETRYQSEIDPIPAHELRSWYTLLSLAQNDFNEQELVDMSWEVIERLLGHYNLTNPVDIARIQLVWMRKHAVLPSDGLSQDGGYAVPSDMASNISFGSRSQGGQVASSNDPMYIPAAALSRVQSAVTMNLDYQNGPSVSPRRSHQRYVPSHHQKLDWSHVTSKIDTGRRAGSSTPNSRAGSRPGTPRARTPVRSSPSASSIGKPSPMKF